MQHHLSPYRSWEYFTILVFEKNIKEKMVLIKLVKNEQSGKIQVSQEVTHVSTIWLTAGQPTQMSPSLLKCP